MIWFKKYSLEEIEYYAHKRGLVNLLNISIPEMGEDYLRAVMPVTPDLYQIFGIMHGGATCALVETAGSVASRMVLDPEKYYSVGSQISVNHIRPVKTGVLFAVCKAVHIGRQKHVWDIPVYSQDTGKLIAKGELTCAVLSGTM